MNVLARLRTQAPKQIGVVAAIAVGHYVTTMVALVLATWLQGAIDADPSRAAGLLSSAFFGLFLALCKPLGHYWLGSGSQSGTAWMLANGVIWAVGLILLFHIVAGWRRSLQRARH